MNVRGVFVKVPKTFVEQDSTKIINLNKVLKNNFKNGSYILEFFDTEKRIDREMVYSLKCLQFRYDCELCPARCS